MPVRMICWNVEKFGPNVMGNANILNPILETVHPNAGARVCDLFIIVEPRNNQNVPAGDIAQGNGSTAIFQFLGNLQARANAGSGVGRGGRGLLPHRADRSRGAAARGRPSDRTLARGLRRFPLKIRILMQVAEMCQGTHVLISSNRML